MTSLNAAGWNTINLTNMRNMFYDCSSLTALATEHWNLYKLTNIKELFYNCAKLSCNMTLRAAVSSYSQAFNNAATDATAAIKVCYADTCTKDIADSIVATRSTTSNVTVFAGANTAVQTPGAAAKYYGI